MPGWADVPPLRGVLEPVEPVVSSQSFRDGLAALTPPTPFLAPLGHEISPDAPAGLVSGIASPPAPVERRPAGDLSFVQRVAARVSRPVQRWVGTATHAPVPEAMTVAPPPAPSLAHPDGPPPPAHHDGPSGVPPGPERADVVRPVPQVPSLASAPPVTAIQRSLRPVELPASPRPPADAPPAPLAPVGVTAIAPPGPTPAPDLLVNLPPALPQAAVLARSPLSGPDTSPRDPESVAPIGPTPTTPTSPVVQRLGPPATAAPVPVQEPAVVQRRPGLGAPLAERPPVRLPEPVIDLPVPPEAAAPLLGEITAPAPREAEVAAPERPALEDLPLVVAQRVPTPSLAGTPAPAVTALLPARAPSPMIAPVRPPLEPPAPPVVPLQRRTGSAPPFPVPSAGDRPVGPSPVPSAGHRPVGPSPVSLAPASPGPVPPEPPGDTATPVTPRPHPVVQRLQSAVTTAAPGRPAGPPPSLALPLRSESSHPTGMVQRAVDSDPVTPAEAAVPVPPPAPPPPAMPELPALPDGDAVSAVLAGTAAAAGDAVPAGDLDALAGRLYDKIRYRLKAELRLDRERAGLITDRR